MQPFMCACVCVFRLVEGDIFRIGMHLDDTKEMIDKNLCEQISPPHSSSTPMPMKDKLHVRPGSVCMLTPSPPPSLHEVTSSQTHPWRHPYSFCQPRSWVVWKARQLFTLSTVKDLKEFWTDCDDILCWPLSLAFVHVCVITPTPNGLTVFRVAGSVCRIFHFDFWGGATDRGRRRGAGGGEEQWGRWWTGAKQRAHYRWLCTEKYRKQQLSIMVKTRTKNITKWMD